MKVLFTLAMLLASSNSFALAQNCGGKLGACPSTVPEYTGPYVAGPQYPVGPTGGKEGKPAGYGPEYTGCEEGRTVAFVGSYHVNGQRDDQTVITELVCHDNQWIPASN